MMRGMTILWTGLALIVGIGLFMLKYEVQSLEERLAKLNGQIRSNQEAIHVLKAEWSYLNDPERLRQLNDRYLHLSPFKAESIVALHAVPLAPQTLVEAPKPAPRPTEVAKAPPKTLEAKAPAPVVKPPGAPHPVEAATPRPMVVKPQPVLTPVPATAPLALPPAGAPRAADIMVIQSPNLGSAGR